MRAAGESGREGPSATAGRVAAYRLGFEREPVPYGDAAADEALARDVAAPLDRTEDDPMGRYLRGRTAFFDRAVVHALERDVTQLVSVGAGYDGRAYRYGKPGTRWWEVDHPATQADKLERLRRLGIVSDHVRFLAHDLREPGLADHLVASGYEPDAAAMLLCEGVSLYLDLAVFGALLQELRSLAAVGTRLAVSLRPEPSPEGSERRARFEATVAALGEPVHNALTAGGAADLLRSTGWEPLEVPEPAHLAGLVMLAPAG